MLVATPRRRNDPSRTRSGPCGQWLTAFNTESISRLTGNRTWEGEIDGSTARNITGSGRGLPGLGFKGWGSGKRVRNGTLESITINGKRPTLDSRYLVTNEPVENLAVK